VGWCGFGVRDQMGRLTRSRTIPVVDEIRVWSILCFTVRVGYRRRGLGRVLLDGVVEYATRHGAPALEAYPVDPDGRRVHATAAYVGTTGMFEEAGFRRVTKTEAQSARLPRWLMRRELNAPTSRSGSTARPAGASRCLGRRAEAAPEDDRRKEPRREAVRSGVPCCRVRGCPSRAFLWCGFRVGESNRARAGAFFATLVCCGSYLACAPICLNRVVESK
jgi:N-acetylglutamate synthase-like GNAT family acetyltransferase